MAKKSKEAQMNLYYMKEGQAKNSKKKKTNNKKVEKEREKRIKQNQKQRSQKEKFDMETETVIQMTNKNNRKKEEQKRRELTKQEKKRKKRNRRIKFFIKLVLIIGLISGGIVFALTSPIFNIKNINVLNNNQLSSDTIISLSELKQEENIFKFYSKKVKDKIKENPYIENVKIHRKLPSTIEIEIEEREPNYSVDFMGKYAYINKQGYLLEISEDSKQLPILIGSSTAEENMVLGNRLDNEDLTRLEDVIKIMNSATEKKLDKMVTSIDISDKNNYSIYLEQEKKKVHLGQTNNLSNKMLYVVSIIEQEQGKEGDIYVDGDLNNKFQPYFREKV